MTTRPQILVAFDFSESAELALRHVINLAHESPERDFHFVVALDPRKGLGLHTNKEVNYHYTEEVQELATQHIRNAIVTVGGGGSLSMMVHVRIGEAVAQILSLAQEVGASLILVGSHGRTGVGRFVLGSVSEQVVRQAQCPVLVTRERAYEDVQRVEIIEVPRDNTEYVPPHRYVHHSGVPTRPKEWVLY